MIFQQFCQWKFRPLLAIAAMLLHESERVEPQWCHSKTHCSGSRVVFSKSTSSKCYCDNACFETFHDCCPDYVSACGKQNSTGHEDEEKTTFSSWWECVPLGLAFNEGCLVIGPTGVWMIHKCPSTWPSDRTKRICENATEESHTYPIVDSLPVVADNRFTYRNYHCAICHGVKKYSTWEVILDNGGTFKNIGPAENQQRRYCVGQEKYISGCSDVSHYSYKDCLNGPIEVVVDSVSKNYFKNKACAACNGQAEARFWSMAYVCASLPEGFSIVMNIRSPDTTATSRIVEERCPEGKVFDKILEFCRLGYETSGDDILPNEFLIIFWFWLRPPVLFNIFELRYPLRTALTTNFNLMPSQISSMKFHNQDINGNYIVTTFRLTLTPFQALLLDGEQSRLNISGKSRRFIKLLNLNVNFTLHFRNQSFPVIKSISKRLSCFEGRVLKSDEYQRDDKTGVVFENKTRNRQHFPPKDYYILGGEEGNITICRKLVFSHCTKAKGYSYVPLRRGEYVIFSNLSLYHNGTNRLFDFGEYQISEDINEINASSPNGFDPERNEVRFENRIFLTHATLAICLPYQRGFNVTVTQHRPKRSEYAIVILTFIGFGISIIWLLLLLITYGIFEKLRTIPGLNLINLCFSLLLYHLVWLVGTGHSNMRTLCTVIAILDHYLILVSFVAMSVISYHSCLVFSQSFAIVKTTKAKARRTILKYSAIVWCCPAIFVATCVIVDKTRVFAINYGTDCWLGTKNAKLYLFLLPIASLLLYNMSAFIRTAASLCRHQTQMAVLQKKRRQNLLICAKLSSVVGFPWILAFFGVVFPAVVAFEYLFVIFVCLQGLYIGVAFLCNIKTMKLYKNRWNKKREKRGGTNIEMTALSGKKRTYHISSK